MGSSLVAGTAVAVMRIAIVATSVHWQIAGNIPWFIVGAACFVLTLLPATFLAGSPLRDPVNVGLSGFLSAHIVLGMHAGLYETSAWFDKGLHVVGCGAISALTVALAVRYGERRRILLPAPVLWALAVAVAVSLGTLWEVFEFAVDSTGLVRAQRGLADTMLDLIADTAGAALVAGLMIASAGRRLPAGPDAFASSVIAGNRVIQSIGVHDEKSRQVLG